MTGDTVRISFLDDSDAPSLNASITGVTFRLNLSAVLEPDADQDGYGDVSQDRCPQLKAVQAPCPTPDTKITKVPRKKVAPGKVTIAFTCTVKGSTFTCAVDTAKAKPCRLPYTATYKAGKHQVVVTAVSPATIADRAPAVVRFTVTKKR